MSYRQTYLCSCAKKPCREKNSRLKWDLSTWPVKLCCIVLYHQSYHHLGAGQMETLFRTTYWINIIHKKISSCWLAESMSINSKQCTKVEIECKKLRLSVKTWYWIDWQESRKRETHRWPIKSFVFTSSAGPGWPNLWRNFSLIEWYASCLLYTSPSPRDA